jgi:hypothetical protein
MALFCVVWNRSSRHWGGEYGGVDGGYAGDVAPVSPDPNKAIHSTGIFGRGAIAEIPDMEAAAVDAVAPLLCRCRPWQALAAFGPAGQ